MLIKSIPGDLELGADAVTGVRIGSDGATGVFPGAGEGTVAALLPPSFSAGRPAATASTWPTGISDGISVSIL
jgi:hypothetical protein